MKEPAACRSWKRPTARASNRLRTDLRRPTPDMRGFRPGILGLGFAASGLYGSRRQLAPAACCLLVPCKQRWQKAAGDHSLQRARHSSRSACFFEYQRKWSRIAQRKQRTACRAGREVAEATTSGATATFGSGIDDRSELSGPAIASRSRSIDYVAIPEGSASTTTLILRQVVPSLESSIRNGHARRLTAAICYPE